MEVVLLIMAFLTDNLTYHGGGGDAVHAGESDT
jgi:hypothetical protein